MIFNKTKTNKTKKNKTKISKKSNCFTIYNPYHEYLVYEYYANKNRTNKLMKEWNNFKQNLKKDGYNCIKSYGGLITKSNNVTLKKVDIKL